MAEQNKQSAPAPSKPALAFPSDERLKAIVEQAATDVKRSATTNIVCALSCIRALAEAKVDLQNAEHRKLAMHWLVEHGHGLASNASQLGQWATGKQATAKKALADDLIV